MAFYCRDEARAAGSTDLLGRSIRDALGGLGAMRDVLALSEGDASGDGARLGPGVDFDFEFAEAAGLLRVARRARREALAQAPARSLQREDAA
jgi:hypothetical protein